jgi:hypothetical protein
VTAARVPWIKYASKKPTVFDSTFDPTLLVATPIPPRLPGRSESARA